MILLAGVAGYVYDGALKTSSEPGFCPPDPHWTVTAEHLGAFWSQLERTDAHRRLTDEKPHPYQALERHVYNRSGVRPSGLRWSVWMGHAFLAARSDEGWGFSTRPGLLLRAADRVHRILYGKDADGIGRYTDYYFGWRGGFLVVSRERAYVAAALQANAPQSIVFSSGPDEIRIQWGENLRGLVRVEARDGLPVKGRIDARVRSRVGPLSHADIWPEPVMLRVTASRWSDLRALYNEAAPFLRAWEPVDWVLMEFEAMWRDWALQAPPAGWDDGLDETAFSLWRVEWHDAAPLPVFAGVLRDGLAPRARHPLSPMVDSMTMLPFEWAGHAGTYTPLFSDAFGICLGDFGGAWLVASRERVMRELVTPDHVGQPGRLVHADAAVELDWRLVGESIRAFLEQASPTGLISRMSPDDVNFSVMPIVDVVEDLGRLRLEGSMADGMLHFQGHLALGVRRAVE